MARRMLIGTRPDGWIDVVISRPGHDAGTADRNNYSHVSFAASRDKPGRVTGAGEVTGLGVNASFGSWGTEVPIIIGFVRGNDQMTDSSVNHTDSFGTNYKGTPFVGVVTPGNVMIIRQMEQLNFEGADKFIYMAVE